MSKLIPIGSYKGATSGSRKATPAEQSKLGRTTFANGTNRKVLSTGNVIMVLSVEYYVSKERIWKPCMTFPRDINSRPIKKQWAFNSVDKAAAFISAYMQKYYPKATPNNKANLPYMFSSTGYWKNNQFRAYDNPNWDNGATLFAQWTDKDSKAYPLRYTWEQIRDLRFTGRDYHDPEQPQWSHTTKVTSRPIEVMTDSSKIIRWEHIPSGVKPIAGLYKGKTPNLTIRAGERKTFPRTEDKLYKSQYTHSRSGVRTYLDADPEDTSFNKSYARKMAKRAIEREYDDYRRHELAMNSNEYRAYKRGQKNYYMLKGLEDGELFRFVDNQGNPIDEKIYIVIRQNPNYYKTVIVDCQWPVRLNLTPGCDLEKSLPKRAIELTDSRQWVQLVDKKYF